MSIWFGLFLCLCYNLYFLFLLPETNTAYLIYLDILLGVCGLIYGLAVGLKQKHRREKKAKYLPYQTIIYQDFPEMKDYDIAEHDAQVLQNQLKEQFDLNQDLQDYIAKWCHEVKLPLAAGLLMAERMEDGKLRGQMQEQLERINQQLKSALLGCKVQSSLFDIQIKSISLLDCVRASIGNSQFFLIKNHFELDIEVEDVPVYTDKNWLVYVLDQLISNAIKYAAEDRPLLKLWSEQKELPPREFSVLGGSSGRRSFGDIRMQLFIEDNGEGISDSDIRRIFEKGYTGSNHHNGKYKSTGMGLYMVAKIMEKLGHRIFVESEEGKYTRFGIEFCKGCAYFEEKKNVAMSALNV